jgi:hypothetical protein
MMLSLANDDGVLGSGRRGRDGPGVVAWVVGDWRCA